MIGYPPWNVQKSRRKANRLGRTVLTGNAVFGIGSRQQHGAEWGHADSIPDAPGHWSWSRVNRYGTIRPPLRARTSVEEGARRMPGDATQSFTCVHCKRTVPVDALGTKHRNHCPTCLWSKHVALEQSQHDRGSECHGPMEPISIATQKDGEWSVVHRCTTCGLIRTNRVAGDDDEVALLCLALRPLADMPFPLEALIMQRAGRPKGE